ncbi:hypothetical protein Memar_0374 [Methanoculleus marisnigri JR1]|uniref:Uncharacterized protein n=1 Tax=Methanoculleus marisnigri (strain ATCC 35101 / DSM 1498 / JR1) TaxID=368407 RepID=A3CSF7_METMJ|nr:hypothetical protein Memar_0374 [Methanoculleus marisnigri JR1]
MLRPDVSFPRVSRAPPCRKVLLAGYRNPGRSSDATEYPITGVAGVTVPAAGLPKTREAGLSNYIEAKPWRTGLH